MAQKRPSRIINLHANDLAVLETALIHLRDWLAHLVHPTEGEEDKDAYLKLLLPCTSAEREAFAALASDTYRAMGALLRETERARMLMRDPQDRE